MKKTILLSSFLFASLMVFSQKKSKSPDALDFNILNHSMHDGKIIVHGQPFSYSMLPDTTLYSHHRRLGAYNEKREQQYKKLNDALGVVHSSIAGISSTNIYLWDNHLPTLNRSIAILKNQFPQLNVTGYEKLTDFLQSFKAKKIREDDSLREVATLKRNAELRRKIDSSRNASKARQGMQ